MFLDVRLRRIKAPRYVYAAAEPVAGAQVDMETAHEVRDLVTGLQHSNIDTSSQVKVDHKSR